MARGDRVLHRNFFAVFFLEIAIRSRTRIPDLGEGREATLEPYPLMISKLTDYYFPLLGPPPRKLP